MAGYSETAQLINSTNLRAMLLALRSDVRRFRPPDDPDPQHIELINHPFEAVDDASDRLSRLETRLREKGDRRAVFLTIYERMTREVHNGITHGRFQDSEWLRDYLITFANYYRRAFFAFEQGTFGAVPDPWRIAFGTAINGNALLIQDAFLGVNAHINYDLALTLNDIGIDPNRPQKYTDHRAINDILARLVDAQQEALAEIYAAGIDDIDALFQRFDESLTLLSMTEGREQAWRIAVILTDVGIAPIASYARWVLRATATGGAYFILGPPLDPSIQRTLRYVEADGLSLDTVLERVERKIDETT